VKTLADRLWVRVDRSRGADACWEWQGHRNPAGYGQIGRGKRGEGSVLTHRAALELHLGRSLGLGMLACHRCDNPPCCNPAHLYEGSPLSNVADMHARGRANYPTGADSWRSRFSDEQIAQMVSRVAAGETRVAVARDYGCAPAYVGQLYRGVTARSQRLGLASAGAP
jgi:hypothetical protein